MKSKKKIVKAKKLMKCKRVSRKSKFRNCSIPSTAKHAAFPLTTAPFSKKKIRSTNVPLRRSSRSVVLIQKITRGLLHDIPNSAQLEPQTKQQKPPSTAKKSRGLKASQDIRPDATLKTNKKQSVLSSTFLSEKENAHTVLLPPSLRRNKFAFCTTDAAPTAKSKAVADLQVFSTKGQKELRSNPAQPLTCSEAITSLSKTQGFAFRPPLLENASLWSQSNTKKHTAFKNGSKPQALLPKCVHQNVGAHQTKSLKQRMKVTVKYNALKRLKTQKMKFPIPSTGFRSRASEPTQMRINKNQHKKNENQHKATTVVPVSKTVSLSKAPSKTLEDLYEVRTNPDATYSVGESLLMKEGFSTYKETLQPKIGESHESDKAVSSKNLVGGKFMRIPEPFTLLLPYAHYFDEALMSHKMELTNQMCEEYAKQLYLRSKALHQMNMAIKLHAEGEGDCCSLNSHFLQESIKELFKRPICPFSGPSEPTASDRIYDWMPCFDLQSCLSHELRKNADAILACARTMQRVGELQSVLANMQSVPHNALSAQAQLMRKNLSQTLSLCPPNAIFNGLVPNIYWKSQNWYFGSG